MLAGIDDPKLDSTASHPSSSSHSLLRSPCRLSSRAPCADDYGWCGSMASVHILLVIHWSAAGFGYGCGRESSVSAVVSATAITGLQLWRHFRLQPKSEKLGSVGL